MQRQELLQQQVGLDALAAASGGVAGMPPLRNDPALGLGPPARRAASLVRPPLSLDTVSNLSSFAEKYPTTSSLLSSSLLPPPVNRDGLPLASELGREGLGGISAHHRALLNRARLLEGEDSALMAAAGFGGSAGAFQGGSLLPKMNPVLLSRSAEMMMGSPVGMSGDSIRQAVLRERAIAAAAEARSLGAPEADPYEPASKRLRKSY